MPWQKPRSRGGNTLCTVGSQCQRCIRDWRFHWVETWYTSPGYQMGWFGNLGGIHRFKTAIFFSDEHGLAYFDGTQLYEHEDPRKGLHPDWKSYIFNYGRNEVRNFLTSSALLWNMGWMYDMLNFMSKDPVYRKHQHNQLTFSVSTSALCPAEVVRKGKFAFGISDSAAPNVDEKNWSSSACQMLIGDDVD